MIIFSLIRSSFFLRYSPPIFPFPDANVVQLVEVYGIAVHYYLENEIKIDSCSVDSVKVVTNQYIDLTEEEKAEARQNAIREFQKEELQKLQNRKKQIVKKELQVEPSLFD